MAQKQIYVKDEDIKYFEQASDYYESQSRAIVEGLKLLIASKNKEKLGKVIEIKIGDETRRYLATEIID